MAAGGDTADVGVFGIPVCYFGGRHLAGAANPGPAVSSLSRFCVALDERTFDMI